MRRMVEQQDLREELARLRAQVDKHCREAQEEIARRGGERSTREK